jgi:hypothetical protein
VAVTGVPSCGVSVKLDVVIVDAVMSRSKVAVTVLLIATPVLPSLGVTLDTVGGAPAPVVKDHVTSEASVPPQPPMPLVPPLSVTV